MSDTLKTAVSSINRWNRWDDGEQPTAEKFKFFFSAYSASLNTIANILGPSFDSAAIATTKERVSSSHSYESLMSAGEQEDFLSLANTQITNTFNLARVIGPHAVLNPQHLPGSVHKISGQPSSGQALATGTKQQQLAFPPIENYNWTITGASGWQRAGSGNAVTASKEGVAAAITNKYFYIDDAGTFYSSQVFPSGAFIKYDLKVPNTYSYLGAGYNCIPDLSILTLADEDRLQDGEYGALRISYDSTYVSTSTSRWKVTLPKVTSLKDSVFKTNEKQVAADGYEPAGTYSVTSGKNGRYYTLPTDLYLTSAGESYKIEDNLICLYDGRTKQSFMLKWELNPDSALVLEDATGNLIQNAFYCYGPKNLESIFYDDGVGALLSSNTENYNSKDFFIFTLGSTITEQLAQTSLNFSRHRHDGSDSYRIYHNDLLGSQGEVQGLGNQLGGTGGLNFISYNRQLSYSDAKDNVHPQYFHRLGYRYGGSHGIYEAYSNIDKLLDLNAIQGDILLYPIEKSEKTYFYADIESYNEVSDGDPINTPITWDFDGPVSDVATFWRRRGHAFIFGWPSDVGVGKYTTGATKLYYENGIMQSETNVDNMGLNWTLSRHGFVPGDYTSPTTFGRGLNIGWGNLFFGYREDIFGGRLADGGSIGNEANAYFRTGEFNIVTTANKRAGQNTNSYIKQGYAYRDGFAVRALEGSSIWLSAGAGAQDSALAEISTGKNDLSVPGTIALEASYLPYKTLTDDKGLSLTTDALLDTYGTSIGSGAGVFLTPGPFIDTAGTDTYRNPWTTGLGNDKFAALWDVSGLGNVLTGAETDYAGTGPGPILDIFAIAPDRQSANTISKGNIPPGRDNSLLGWVFGRPFIRGTYGINFCVNGEFVDGDPDFITGFSRKASLQNWGPNTAVLKTSTKEYIHREYRFWGKNQNQQSSAATDSLANTAGGNINLLYKFGKNYNRFGVSQNWSSTNSLSGIAGYAQWSNSRRIAIGSSKPEDYGSSIRQASYIEAFKGFRSDPLQPYLAHYVIPFTAEANLGPNFATYLNLRQYIRKQTFILAEYIDGNPATLQDYGIAASQMVNPGLDPEYTLLTLNSSFADLKFDSVIRGSEEILLESGNNILTNFPSSLVSFDVKLEYYVGQNADGSSVGVGDADSPHDNANASYYARLTNGEVVMVPAAEAEMTGNQSDQRRVVPVVAVGSTGGHGEIPPAGMANSDPLETDSAWRYAYNGNMIMGYTSAIGMWPNTHLNSGYRARFPLFEQYGRGSLVGNKQFCVLLNVKERLDDADMYNANVPYQLYMVGTQPKIRFRGTIHLTMMTAFHKAPANNGYTA